jgi:hypothetical protein
MTIETARFTMSEVYEVYAISMFLSLDRCFTGFIQLITSLGVIFLNFLQHNGD